MTLHNLIDKEGEGKTSWVADPNNPTPSYNPEIEDLDLIRFCWRVLDQTHYKSRNDVVWWTTAITEDLIVAGGKLSFYGSTTGTDCDWVVKVIDIHPEDDPDNPSYHMAVSDVILRSKYR